MNKHKRNKGFTLLELIVVVAIMGIAIGFVSFSFGTLLKFQAQGCAQDIKSTLDLTRTNAMAMGGASVEITKDSTTGEIMVTRSGGQPETVGKSTVVVTYGFKGDATVYTLGDAAAAGHPLVISFSTSGGINDSNAVEWIRISGNKTYKLTLYKLTGKTTMESE